MKKTGNPEPVKEFRGQALRWEWRDGVVELTLDHEPLNEIGTTVLGELEKFVAAIDRLAPVTSTCIIASARPGGFSAGGDLRELYHSALGVSHKKRASGAREYIERIHRTFNALDAAPFVTIAAVHGVCLGGGLELALLCDLIVADKMSRFGFPELRLGIIPGFGGIPRLRRNVGNSFIRDLLFTGRTVKAETAQQIKKFDPEARIAAKAFAKPIPYKELREEAAIFLKLFNRPAVMEGLKRFVESDDPMRHLPVASKS